MQRHEHELLKYAVSGVVSGMDRRRLWLLAGVLVLLTVFGVVAAFLWRAASPGAPALLPPPYLRLRHLYEEPNGHGWGVDLPLTFSPLGCSPHAEAGLGAAPGRPPLSPGGQA